MDNRIFDWADLNTVPDWANPNTITNWADPDAVTDWTNFSTITQWADPNRVPDWVNPNTPQTELDSNGSEFDFFQTLFGYQVAVEGDHETERDLAEKLASFSRTHVDAQFEAELVLTRLQADLATAKEDIETSRRRVWELENELDVMNIQETELVKQHQDATWVIEQARKAEGAQVNEIRALVGEASKDWARLETLVSLCKEDLESSSSSTTDNEKAQAQHLNEAKDGVGQQLDQITAQADYLMSRERAKIAAVESTRTQFEHHIWKLREEVTATRGLVEEEKAKIKLLTAAKKQMKQRLQRAVLRSKRMYEQEMTRTENFEGILEKERIRIRATEAAKRVTLRNDRDAAFEQLTRLSIDLHDATTLTQELDEQRKALHDSQQRTLLTNQALSLANQALATKIAALEQKITTLEGPKKSWQSRLRSWTSKHHIWLSPFPHLPLP